MSQIKISSTGWLVVSLRNGTAGVFDLNDTPSWQFLQSESSVDANRNLIKFSPNGQMLVS